MAAINTTGFLMVIGLLLGFGARLVVDTIKEVIDQKVDKKQREQERVMDLQSLVRWDIEVTQKQNKLLQRQLDKETEKDRGATIDTKRQK